MTIVRSIALASFAFLLAASAAFAQNVRLIAKGYDPVAYFTDGKAVKGDPAIAFEWDEGRYHFASQKNRDLFAAEPDRYAPRFGATARGPWPGARNNRTKAMAGHGRSWTENSISSGPSSGATTCFRTSRTHMQKPNRTGTSAIAAERFALRKLLKFLSNIFLAEA